MDLEIAMFIVVYSFVVLLNTNPVIEVDWNLPGLAPGTYNFFVTYHANSCPLNSDSSRYRRSPEYYSSKIIAATHCIHKALVQYTMNNGLVPRNVVVHQKWSYRSAIH